MSKLRISAIRCHCGFTLNTALRRHCFEVKKTVRIKETLERATLVECTACQFRWTVAPG